MNGWLGDVQGQVSLDAAKAKLVGLDIATRNGPTNLGMPIITNSQ